MQAAQEEGGGMKFKVHKQLPKPDKKGMIGTLSVMGKRKAALKGIKDQYVCCECGAKISYQLWEELSECPQCGHGEVEYDTSGMSEDKGNPFD